MQHLKQLVTDGLEAVAQAADEAALDQVRVQYLGKKGELTQQLKSLGKLSAEERHTTPALSASGPVQRRESWTVSKKTFIGSLCRNSASSGFGITMPISTSLAHIKPRSERMVRMS